MRRSAIVLANTVSYSLCAGASAFLAQHIISLGVLVTLGPAIFVMPPVWLGRIVDGPLPLWWLAPIAVGSFVLYATLDPRRAGDWSLRTAIAPVPVIGVLAFVMFGYRLVGLLLAVVVIAFYVRYALGRGRLAPLAYAMSALIVVSVQPLDITLQDVPGPPRIVPAVSGLPTREMSEMIKKGDAVYVGGCVARYLEPTRVVVW